jgi:Pol polyprotein, beta-barrel domain
MIRMPTSGIHAHPSKEQLCIHMIQTSTLGIVPYPFNASDSTTITFNAWIFDTAYIYHMAYNSELFYDYNQFPTSIAVREIGLGEHLAYGQGTLHIVSLRNEQASNEHHLEYVWSVPKMDINIISKS